VAIRLVFRKIHWNLNIDRGQKHNYQQQQQEALEVTLARIQILSLRHFKNDAQPLLPLSSKS